MFDPRWIEGTQTMNGVETRADPQHFECAMQWMRPRIPKFFIVIRPLCDRFEKVYEMVGKRPKVAAGRILLCAVG